MHGYFQTVVQTFEVELQHIIHEQTQTENSLHHATTQYNNTDRNVCPWELAGSSVSFSVNSELWSLSTGRNDDKQIFWPQ